MSLSPPQPPYLRRRERPAHERHRVTGLNEHRAVVAMTSPGISLNVSMDSVSHDLLSLQVGSGAVVGPFGFAYGTDETGSDFCEFGLSTPGAGMSPFYTTPLGQNLPTHSSVCSTIQQTTVNCPTAQTTSLSDRHF